MLPAERPSPSATGSLDKRPLAHLLVYALERRLTGTMEIVSAEATGCFYLVEGQPQKVSTSAATDLPSAPGAALTRMDRLFEMPIESTFAYYDGFDALPGEACHPMEALALVWRGIKRAPPWQHVHVALTRIGNAALRLSAPPDEVLTQFAFDATERQLVELLVSSPQTMHDLMNAGILAAGRAQLLAYCLVITKKADVTAVAPPAPLPVVPAVAMAPPSISPNRAPTIEPAPPSLLPRDIPPVVPSAPASSSTVARLRLARTPTRGGLLEEKPQVSSSDPRRSVTPPGVAAVEDSGQAARRAEIIARAQAIDNEDYFTMLAIPRDASSQLIQTAFFALAKQWHPDRLSSGLADVKDACSRVFARMSEAHQTLSDNERRGRYMRLLTEGGATPKDQETIASVVEAATSFQKAEIFLKRGDVVQAEAFCRRATKLDPKQPDYHALLAWLESMKPENQGPTETRALIARLTEAIAVNANCERAFFYRGLLSKRLGDEAAAIRDFRSASELNPRNVDAQREVRLFAMRGGSSAPGKAKSRSVPDAHEARPSASKSGSPKSGSPKPPPTSPKDAAKGFLNRLFKK